MPRSRRIVTLCALPASLSDEERVRRTARATAVLLRIAARLTTQTPEYEDLSTENEAGSAKPAAQEPKP